MAQVTKNTRIVMRYQNDWQACTIRSAEQLKLKGWIASAVSPSPQQAAQIILGLRSNELVTRLLSHLTPETQTLVKTEIAQMATDYHNMLK